MSEHIFLTKILAWRSVKRIVLILVIIFIFDFIFFTVPALANEQTADIENETILFNDDPAPVFNYSLPENSQLAVKYWGYYNITAYSSEINQCDGAPCLTANGFNLCEYGIEDSIAVNFLKFGTKVKIPELFGDKVFIVRDRMNERYADWIDIWMKDKSEAKKFGVKWAKIEILEP